MNKLKLPLIILISLLIYVQEAYSFLPERINSQTVISDEKLKTTAINKDLISKTPDREKSSSCTNSLAVWFNLDRGIKIMFIDGLIEEFKHGGITIKQSAEYYVTQVNNAIYESLRKGNRDDIRTKGLGEIFKIIVVMDGDYNNGQSKIETLRESVGSDLLETYRKRYPLKYKHLKVLDKEMQN